MDTDFDKTLTQDELNAPTFVEWSDATLARCVRHLAKKLHDDVGFYGITGAAAAIALEKVAKDANATKFEVTLDDKTKVLVRVTTKKAKK